MGGDALLLLLRCVALSLLCSGGGESGLGVGVVFRDELRTTLARMYLERDSGLARLGRDGGLPGSWCVFLGAVVGCERVERAGMCSGLGVSLLGCDVLRAENRVASVMGGSAERALRPAFGWYATDWPITVVPAWLTPSSDRPVAVAVEPEGGETSSVVLECRRRLLARARPVVLRDASSPSI
jgi:hypothetical protein